MNKDDFQNLTERIAAESGIQTDSRQFSDPIYLAQMEGNFLRRLKNSKDHSLTKIILSLFAFILPALTLIFIYIAFMPKSFFLEILVVIGAVLLCLFQLLVGLKILLSKAKSKKQ